MEKSIIKELPSKDRCCGCKACEEICPTGALRIVYDSVGFGYPKIELEKCIECGVCTEVCPILNKPLNISDVEKAYVGIIKDHELWMKSASGGAFSALIYSWKQKYSDVFVAGVVYDQSFNAVFMITDDDNLIDTMHKSKYMISNTNGIFEKVKSALNNDNSVVFSGTPCQCAALKNYLGKEYEKLLIVDLVCHGAPSNALFKKYIDEESKKQGQKIVEHTFHDKTETKLGYQLRQASYTLENGEKKIFQEDDDPYSRMYYNRLGYMKCCGACLYANTERISDITICDAHHVEKIYPDMVGSSVIVFHSQKGYDLLPFIQGCMGLRSCTIEWLTENNAQYKEPTKINENTEKFYDMINNGNDFEKSVDACLHISMQKRIKRLMKRIISHI